METVAIKNLSKVYGSQYAVKDLSFSAKRGEVLGFLGPNGAGKSTTMKIATGYLAPSEGSASICGYDISKYPIQAQHKIGYLPENNPLYHEMYVREQLTFAGKAYIKDKATLKRNLERVIELCGLQREQNKHIGQLSKGYKQRVGLAQALIHDPEVLILDEPTTGLDPNQLVEIRALIKEVSHDKTVILSTHIMQEVEAMCDRVVIINQGQKIIEKDVSLLKQERSTKKYLIEFSRELNNEDIASLPPHTSFTPDGTKRYEIRHTGDDDIRADLFDFAVKRGIKILEMRTAPEESMESIFKDLTNTKVKA